MDYSPDVVNNIFLQGLDKPELVKEAQTMFAGYVRAKLRDVEFSRKILPAKNIARSERGIQVSTLHDGLVYIGEVEPHAQALAITWTAEPRGEYIKSRRYEIPFLQISSANYQYTEQELWASRAPLTKLIENNTVKDIGTVEDWYFLSLCNAAVAATGKIVKGTATNAGVASGDIEPDDIINLKNQLPRDERPATTILIGDLDLNKILKWTTDQIGPDDKKGTAYGNKIPETLFSLKVIRTAKTYLLTEGNIWLFSDPDYIGTFLVLENTKFFMKKERDLVSWNSWEFVAMSIANAYSVAKLEIYSGASSALPVLETLFEDRIVTPPVAYPTVVTV